MNGQVVHFQIYLLFIEKRSVMKKILIQFAHPAKFRSKINTALRAAVEGLDDIYINDLYSLYPDFLIDVPREQQLCEEYDAIVFQHPFYWYSTPAIMKEWLDLVLVHGWAFGTKGTKLADKLYLHALTAGGDASAYEKGASAGLGIRELTSPYQATARLCRMHWLPPFVVLGIHQGLSDAQIHAHAEDYRRTMVALRDETLNLEQAKLGLYLNSDLDQIIRKS